MTQRDGVGREEGGGFRMGKQWKHVRLIFWGSKITAHGDCSHEIKKRLLLGRKVMTNLDSICLVKAMVFPVVMYRCESWTAKKAEHQRSMLLNCGVREDC